VWQNWEKRSGRMSANKEPAIRSDNFRVALTALSNGRANTYSSLLSGVRASDKALT
jgi:hypothetical protein